MLKKSARRLTNQGCELVSRTTTQEEDTEEYRIVNAVEDITCSVYNDLVLKKRAPVHDDILSYLKNEDTFTGVSIPHPQRTIS